MIGVFSDILSFLKKKPITITNNVFALHYKVTVVILVAFSLLGTQKQYFGDPIDCHVDTTNDDLDGAFYDTYCWIQSTYIHPELTDSESTISHGVGPGSKLEKKYYTYYQWVPLFIFFQAILFYIPYYLWKSWEGGKIKRISLDLKNPLLNDKEQEQKTSLIVDYFIQNKPSHRHYCYKFFFCEALNLANVIMQIYFVDFFLGYEFTSYGSKVLNYNAENNDGEIDPMALVFPKMTKCDFSFYGLSGTTSNKDALCVLPINIVNEKIFIFLWFWFIILGVVTAVALLYRLLVVFFAPVRQHLISQSVSTVSNQLLCDLVDMISVPEWFLIYQLGKNMDNIAFDIFIIKLYKKLKHNH